jgi:hypothetical protein
VPTPTGFDTKVPSSGSLIETNDRKSYDPLLLLNLLALNMKCLIICVLMCCISCILLVNVWHYLYAKNNYHRNNLVSFRYENAISSMPNKTEFETWRQPHKSVRLTRSWCSAQCVIAGHVTIIQNFMTTFQMFQKFNGGQTPFHHSRIVHSFTPKIYANSLLSVRFNLLITNG